MVLKPDYSYSIQSIKGQRLKTLCLCGEIKWIKSEQDRLVYCPHVHVIQLNVVMLSWVVILSMNFSDFLFTKLLHETGWRYFGTTSVGPMAGLRNQGKLNTLAQMSKIFLLRWNILTSMNFNWRRNRPLGQIFAHSKIPTVYLFCLVGN